MNKKRKTSIYIKFIRKTRNIKVSDILGILKIDRTTIYRDFKELEKQNEIKEISK
jgi:DeoR/GlpR family transcriptional regulator of sugar metabolism